MNMKTIWQKTGALFAALILLGTVPPVDDHPQSVAATATRRVNVWQTVSGPIDDNTASIFWFGRAPPTITMWTCAWAIPASTCASL